MSMGLLLAITSCSSDDDSDNGSMDPDTVAFAVAANGMQEIPATDSTATASGTLTLDQDSGELTGSVSAADITVDAAHLHEAFAGANGDVIITLDVDGETISVPDSTVLTADQQAALTAGSWYLNVHSPENPAGEIRAQLAPDGISVLQVALDGSNEVPTVTSAGTGTAYLTVNEISGATVINVITTGLTTPTAAHLHRGFAGSNGDVLYPLVQDTAEVGNFSSSADTVLLAAELDSFSSGGTYVNVHSDENPAGELRGQVLPVGVSLLSATLTGEQEVPPVTTTALGMGVVTLNENDGTMTAVVTVAEAPTANAGHIHEAAVGVNGDIVIPLTQSEDDAGNFSVSAVSVTTAQINTLIAGGMYFNIHTPENSGGEIRGQIEP